MLSRSNVPNLFTAARLALLPVLWGLAAVDATRLLAVGIAVAASTDFIDGTLARLLSARSELGSRLDSIADHLLNASVFLWILWIHPDFFRETLGALLAWAALGIVTLAVGWFRFRRIGDLHLYSAKAAMTLGYLFVVTLFYTGAYDERHFAVTIAVCFIATAESLLVYLTRSDPHERIGTILGRARTS